MAEQMKDIKRRIVSVSSIRQITNAMELVSTSKMRKTRKRLEATRPYYTTVINNIGELLAVTKGVSTPLTEIRENKKRLYIVIAGDRGLAGGFNGNVLRFAQQRITNKEDSVIAVGVKAYDFLVKRDYKIIKRFFNITENFTFHEAKEIADIVLDMYVKKEIDSVELVYTQFKSAITQVPTYLRLLPSPQLQKKVLPGNNIITFEPSPEIMLDFLVEEFVAISIYGALIESSSSEQAARMQAMRNATDNADDMIDGLSLKYNRARQANITQELSEIVSGAEALK